MLCRIDSLSEPPLWQKAYSWYKKSFSIFLTVLMDHANLLNSVGVAFASTGSILIWRYLTEISFIDKEAYVRGQGVLTVPTPSKSDISRFKRSMLLSKLGIAMILLGGLFQIASNHFAA